MKMNILSVLKTYGIPYVYLNRTYEDDLEHCLRIKNREAGR